MGKFDDVLKNRIDNFLKTDDSKSLYILKGFSLAQNEQFSHYPQSILNDSKLFESGYLDLNILNDRWIDMVQTINQATRPLIGFYEELLVLRDFLKRISIEKIIIIENNCLTPWEPCQIEYKHALQLFDYLQQEREELEGMTALIPQMYGDVMLLDNEKALLLPVVVDDERISTISLWGGEISAGQVEPDVKQIEIGSPEDWVYRYFLTFGEESSVMLIRRSSTTDSAVNGIISALADLEIPFAVNMVERCADKNDYDPLKFKPLLKKYWGSSAEYRPLLFYKDPDRIRETEILSQGSIIAEIVDQCERSINSEPFQNIFITAPTGAGKSILFQIPALYLAEKYECVTIVVSPLIALMNDQVDQLQREHGISIAACLNSTMTVDERMDVIEQIKTGQKSLLYLAPELLLTTHLVSFLNGRTLGLVVIDEAHTVTSWGRDFRTDYWFLGDFLKKARRDGTVFPLLCLTATAVYSGEDDVVNDTIHELGLEKTIIHLGNVKRNNIDFDIVRHDREDFNMPIEAAKMNLTLRKLRECIHSSEKVLTYFPWYAPQKLDQFQS